MQNNADEARRDAKINAERAFGRASRVNVRHPSFANLRKSILLARLTEQFALPRRER